MHPTVSGEVGNGGISMFNDGWQLQFIKGIELIPKITDIVFVYLFLTNKGSHFQNIDRACFFNCLEYCSKTFHEM